MRALVVDENNCYVQDGHGQIMLSQRPVLSFTYDELRYDVANVVKYCANSEGVLLSQPLSDADVEEIENFIDAQRQAYGVRVLAVDDNGRYLGSVRVDDQRTFHRVASAPPNTDDHVYDFMACAWVRAYAYDREGKSVALADAAAVGYSKVPPPYPFCRWDFDMKLWRASLEDMHALKLVALGQLCFHDSFRVVRVLLQREKLFSDDELLEMAEVAGAAAEAELIKWCKEKEVATSAADRLEYLFSVFASTRAAVKSATDAEMVKQHVDVHAGLVSFIQGV